MRFSRFFSLLTALALALCLLAGCSQAAPAPADSHADSAADGKSIQLVCTVFPVYDWVQQITAVEGTNISATLLGGGTDLHSYQPSAGDMMTMANADLLFYIGGTSDAWMSDVLKSTANPDRIALSLMDTLGSRVREEEVVEGMEAEAEEEHGAEEGPEYDEHIWLSVRNAQVLCRAICDAVCTADPENADAYRANTDAYLAKLSQLDEAYQQLVDSAARKTVLFGDRFPFRYLVEDYGLTYYAAFVGCSSETEASFSTIAFLADKMDELQLPVVLVTENSTEKIAKTIIENTQSKNQTILAMDSLQNAATNADTNYLAVMEANLAVLDHALNDTLG